MKFAILALLGVASVTARTTTIKINEDTLEKIARTWEKNERQLERTLEGLYRDEMKELDPYFRSVQDNLQKVERIDNKYNRMMGREFEKSVVSSWGQTYADLGCDPAARARPQGNASNAQWHKYYVCKHPDGFVSNIDRAF